MGITPFLSFEMPIPGSSFSEGIFTAIDRAGFYIFVLGRASTNSNVLFEIGYAAAQKKRILIVAPRDAEIPQALENYFVIRADPASPRGLKFAIQQLIQAPKSSPHKSARRVARTTKIPDQAAETVRALKRLGSRATELEVVHVLADLLHESGIKVVVEHQTAGPHGKRAERVDMALWVDELNALVGNPVLIQVKRHLRVEDARRLRDEALQTYLSVSSRALLVVFVMGNEDALSRLNVPIPLVMFVKLQTLISLLQENSFGNVVRQFRNKIVHGGH